LGLFAPFVEIPTTAKWLADKENSEQVPKKKTKDQGLCKDYLNKLSLHLCDA
jgi:hypothetical protein